MNAAERCKRRGLRRFASDASGASALEFALVATPLILLLLGILEVGLVYAGTYELDSATAQGARLIRTGQAQGQGFDSGKFKTELCKHLFGPISCSGLKLDVRHYTSFSDASANLTNPLDAGGNLKTGFTYDPGVASQVVVVRAFYEWPLIAKFPKDIALSNMNNGDRLLVATAVFRNEPFQ